MMLLNEQFAPLKDVHVRRAINYAIDRSAIVKAILFGNGQPANSYMPPTLIYYDASSAPAGCRMSPRRSRSWPLPAIPRASTSSS